jgi:hypothetical protein
VRTVPRSSGPGCRCVDRAAHVSKPARSLSRQDTGAPGSQTEKAWPVLDSNHGAQNEGQSHLSTLAVAQLKKQKLTRAAHQVGRGQINARRRRRRRYAESAPGLIQAETSREQGQQGRPRGRVLRPYGRIDKVRAASGWAERHAPTAAAAAAGRAPIEPVGQKAPTTSRPRGSSAGWAFAEDDVDKMKHQLRKHVASSARGRDRVTYCRSCRLV